MTVSPRDELVGAILMGKYRIVRTIGAGGMGAVYEGLHVELGRRVAIKVLHPHVSAQDDFAERFRREALAANAIRHPNIVDVTDIDRLDDGTPFMVLELLEGKSWYEDMRDTGPQPLDRVVHIAKHVCSALAAAHAKKIIHRDVKPANVFLIDHGDDPLFAKILDFGLAKQTGSAEEELTRTGTVLGSPSYMAPEQIKTPKSIDHKVDIYALGVVLFEALAGRRPFVGDSLEALFSLVFFEPPPSIRGTRPDLPDALDRLLATMLAKDPVMRPQSCEDVASALESIAGMTTTVEIDSAVRRQLADTVSAGPSMTSPTTTSERALSPHVETHRSNRSTWVAVMVAVTLLVVGVAVVSHGVWSRSGDPAPDQTDSPAAEETAPLSVAADASAVLANKAAPSDVEAGEEELERDGARTANGIDEEPRETRKQTPRSVAKAASTHVESVTSSDAATGGEPLDVVATPQAVDASPAPQEREPSPSLVPVTVTGGEGVRRTWVQ